MMRRIFNPILSPPAQPSKATAGFTLVEMLIAMAITLVMIGAVVTLFANISNSVRNRRAVVEMSGQLRHARNMLQQDLQGATCPGLTWQRPDENQGYIEIIEGARREGNASVLIDGTDRPTSPDFNPEIDHRTSILPSSNVPFADTTWYTDGRSLGDFDDILMLTVRNEHEPFVGRVPKSDGMPTGVRPNRDDALTFPNWEHTTLESPLAEVVWYAVENPEEDANAENFFGEPGMRTIYRRTLLIAPWINPYRFVHPRTGVVTDTFQIGGSEPTFTAQSGLVRILPASIERNEVEQALACLIAFQERYDLSVRLEFDPLLDPSNNGRWKIVANTLGDLTKRENRYEHHFFRPQESGSLAIGREYPNAVVSVGSEYEGSNVGFVMDPEVAAVAAVGAPAQADANLGDSAGISDLVLNYAIEPDNYAANNSRYAVRPFAYVDEESATVATARAVLNDEGEVVRVVHGLVPLSGDRRGEDVMLSDALGFDLRVYDPGAPLYGMREDPSDSTSPLATILEPTDPAWAAFYGNDMPDSPSASDVVDAFVGQGAYVDLGYGFERSLPRFASGSTAIFPWFFTARALSDVYVESRPTPIDVVYSQLAPGYAVYDTWSFHYENNGVNEDRFRYDGSNWGEVDTLVDESTNGLDEFGSYSDGFAPPADFTRLGPDDVGERETMPPYDKPLRGLQVLLRLYERDSRQVRQVSVNQHFVPE